MKHTTKIHLLIGILLYWSAYSYAAPLKVCGSTLSQNGCNATLTFETDRWGDVVITLTDKGSTTGAVFRDNGMGKKLDNFWVKVSGQPNDSAEHYFERQAPAGGNVFRLHLKDDVTLPEGAVIYFSGTLTWMCDQNNNLWQSNSSYSHTYGTTCAVLDAPVLNSFENYVADFTKVTSANYYTISFYSGTDCVYMGTLNEDGSTNFRPFMTDTYEIVVQAWTNSGLYSNESNAITMSLTGDPQYLPVSEVCELPFLTGTSSVFAIVAESDDNGVITLTAVAADNGAEESTKWRQNGLPNDGLKFNGLPASQFFTRKKSADEKSLILTPIKTANPEIGRLLTFNEYGENENAAWYTSQNNNAYSKNVHFTYRYGTKCLKLATPEITDVIADAPQFEPIEGADKYMAQVYLDGQLKYKLPIKHGGKLNFVPDTTATYQLTLTAYGEGVKHSDESAPFDWYLKKKEIEVGPSEYCNSSRSSGGDQFQISFETLVNGDVEITISGDAKTSFRDAGMGNDLSYFKVGTLGASLYFQPIYTGTGALTYTLHLKDPTYVPGKGEKITFNGTVAYQTATNNNAYGTYSFTYTYGSVCDHLETPVITSLQEDGSWTLDHEITGAEAYRVMVKRDGFLMQDKKMRYGDKLTFSPWHKFIYLVSVQAITSKNVMNSAISNPVEWRVQGKEEELPRSTLCNKGVFTETTCGRIYLNAITDEQGRVIITIDNDMHNIHFRANGNYKGLDKLLFINDPISSYFDMTLIEPDSTQMVLTPKKNAQGMVYTGDQIISEGNLEWISDCNNNGYTKVTFTYLYGTNCNAALPRLATPHTPVVTPLGVVAFDSVQNAQSYLMKVSDGDDGWLGEYLVEPGDTISRFSVILPDFDYYVRLQAWPELGSTEYRESLWSEPYLWNPSVIPSRITIVDADTTKCGKYIINGQFVIIRNGIQYNAQGHRL